MQLTRSLLHMQLKIIIDRFALYTLRLYSGSYPRKLAAMRFIREFEKAIQTWEDFYMPKRNAKKTFNSSLQFARVDLTTAQAKQFEAWLKSGEFDIGQLLIETLTRGESLSIKYNPEEDSFFCTLIGRDESESNAGKGFTSWAHNPDVALLLTLYKYHYVIERIIKLDTPTDSELSFG